MRKTRVPNMGGEVTELNPLQALQSENRLLKSKVEELENELKINKNSNINDQQIANHFEGLLKLKDDEIKELKVGTENLKNEVENISLKLKEASHQVSNDQKIVNRYESLLKAKDEEIKRLRSETEYLKKEIDNISLKLKEASHIEKGAFKPSFYSKELYSISVTKTFKAIKAEVELQGKNEVKLPRRRLEIEYGVNPASTTKAIQTLVDHGFIEIIQESDRKRLFCIKQELPELS